MKHILAAIMLAGLTQQVWAEPLQVEAVDIHGARGEVRLNQPAPNDQTWVELHSDGPLHAPMAVRIPAGETHARFQVLVDPVSSETTTVVYATLKGKGPSQLVFIPIDGEAATR